MANIPANELAHEVLDACLRDGTWPARSLDDLIERCLDEEDQFVSTTATRALFSIVIEQLGDLFEPSLCDVYAKLFSHVIGRALPEYDAADLFLRYRRVRQVRRFVGGEIKRVFVLSRITLGADVAVTSVVLAAAKQRFPDAEICLVGPEKNAEMFADDRQIVPIPVTYGRSSLLRERLMAAAELQVTVNERSSLVIDPDSRLTQLGLIPTCDDSRYFFFESRGFGGTFDSNLPELTAEWLSQVFDVETFHPYTRPARQERIADIAVSLGVGENACKRIDDEFEYQLLKKLLSFNRAIVIDRGAGGEESDRVNALIERLGSPLLNPHDGSYASFASHILQSDLYVGYDSAGQHVASAGHVPLVSVFSGYASGRMLARWRPNSPSSHVVEVNTANRDSVLERTMRAIEVAAAERLAKSKG